MTYLIDQIGRIKWWLLLVLMVLAPFHAFLITWARSLAGTDQSGLIVLAMWREILVALITLCVVAEHVSHKKLPKFDLLDWLIIGFGALALVWLPLQRTEVSRWLLGARFDFLPLFFFLIIRHSVWKDGEKLKQAVIGAAAFGIVFGLLHSLVLPQNFLTRFGYSEYQGQFRPDTAIAACQYLEHTDRVCRATSTFGGPTRYGTYLLFIAGLLLPFLKKSAKSWKFIALFALAILSMVLTFSRSIWFGLLASGFFAFVWLPSRKTKLKILVATVGILVAASAVWYGASLAKKGFPEFPPPFIKTVFIRASSTSEHFALARQGIITALSHPLGLGLGISGPASVRFGKSLTENWFIQIALEVGIPGLLLFLGILVMLSKKLLADKRDLAGLGLFLALFGISVAGLFTHSFEETSTSLLLFGFMGMHLSRHGAWPRQFSAPHG